jgi:hypothetical protein
MPARAGWGYDARRAHRRRHIACRRIEQAQRQRDLFIHTAPNPDVYDRPMRDLFAAAAD